MKNLPRMLLDPEPREMQSIPGRDRSNICFFFCCTSFSYVLLVTAAPWERRSRRSEALANLPLWKPALWRRAMAEGWAQINPC